MKCLGQQGAASGCFCSTPEGHLLKHDVKVTCSLGENHSARRWGLHTPPPHTHTPIFYCLSAGLILSLAFHLLKVRAQAVAALSHPLQCDEREAEANPATVTSNQRASWTRLVPPQSEDIQTCSVIRVPAVSRLRRGRDAKPRQRSTPASVLRAASPLECVPFFVSN